MVITYKSYYAKYRHMALFLTHDGDDGTIFQVVGGAGFFEYDERRIILSNTDKVDKKFAISQIFEDISEMVESIYIENNNSEWNCQHWVSEALLALYNNGIITKDEYKDAATFVANEMVDED